MAAVDAEAEVKKLAKLAENRRCAVCEVEASSFGFGAVCVPFKCFVCSNCKSALQAYSHRVKSITQSNWTPAEADALRARNGGGNDALRRSWLANCAPDCFERPREGEHPDRYKAFVSGEQGVCSAHSARSACCAMS